MKTFIMLNPASSKGKTGQLNEKIRSSFKKLNIDYHLHISKSSEDLKNAAIKSLNDGYSNYIAVGGDGTTHDLINALAETGKNIGVIPSGSGNDIATNLGLPKDIESCCKLINKGHIKKIDMGLINNKYYYVCIAGAGFDSQVTDLANNTKLPINGPARYNYSVYKTLITFRSREFQLSYDGKNRKIPAMMIAASNLKSYGGGMKITPDADPQDGLFDICIIKRMKKLHFVKIFPKVYEGKHITDPHVEIFRTSAFKLESEYNFSVFADGEYICKLPATFKIVPKSLNFIVS